MIFTIERRELSVISDVPYNRNNRNDFHLGPGKLPSISDISYERKYRIDFYYRPRRRVVYIRSFPVLKVY